MMLKEETREVRPSERSFLVAYRNQLATELAEVERQLATANSRPQGFES
jgi:hypothetical protein